MFQHFVGIFLYELKHMRIYAEEQVDYNLLITNKIIIKMKRKL